MYDIECGSFFDHIDDFLDFATEDVTLPLPSDADGNCDSLSDFWNPESDSLPGSDSVFFKHRASDLSANLSVPYEDIVQLEWMSKFVEDSFTAGSLTVKKEDMSSDNANKESGNQRFQTSSPVSVLESSTSCSVEKPSGCNSETLVLGRCGRARSKRPRPTTFSSRPAVQLNSPASSVSETALPFISPKASSNAENFAGSHPVIKLPQKVSTEHKKKKKKTKLSLPLASLETNENSPSQPVRKCLHCEITKTPQWRAGPLGPKTLCNACGVRNKSGRLFPEYRPAASPTFVSSIHSNSHKKVLEMRNKNKENTALDSNAFPELIPNTNSSLIT